MCNSKIHLSRNVCSSYTFIASFLNTDGTFLVDAVPPKIVTKPKDTVVKEGEPVKLKCRGSGIPQPHMKWIRMKDNKGVVSDDRHEVSTAGSLTIRNSLEGDTGRYKCITFADNGWKDEVTVNVTVLGE